MVYEHHMDGQGFIGRLRETKDFGNLLEPSEARQSLWKPFATIGNLRNPSETPGSHRKRQAPNKYLALPPLPPWFVGGAFAIYAYPFEAQVPTLIK